MAIAKQHTIEQNDEETIDVNPDAWRSWPGRQSAPSLVGVDRRRFRELVETGKVEEFDAPDGTKRYQPADLRRLRDELAFEDLPAAKDEPDETTTRVGGVVVDSMKVSNDLLKQNQAHLERVFTIATDGYSAGMRAMSDALNFANKTIAELRRENVSLKALEKRSEAELVEATTDADLKLQAENRKTLLTQAIAPKISEVAGGLLGSIQEAVVQRVAAKPGAAVSADVLANVVQDATLASQAEALVRAIGPDGLVAAKAFASTEEQSAAIEAVLTTLKKGS